MTRWMREVLFFAMSLAILPGSGIAQSARELPSAGASIIDLHGPDGLPFTMDDPLRTATTSHNGVFGVSYNSVSAFPAKTHANVPAVPPLVSGAPAEKTELLFLDLSNFTISRHALSFSFDRTKPDRWGAPLPLSDPPAFFKEGEDYLAGGSALRHEIIGGSLRDSGERNISREADAATLLDPRMIMPKKSGGAGGLIQKLVESGIDYVMLERLSIDKAQIFALMQVSNEFQTGLAFAFRIRIGEMWAKLNNNMFGGLIGLVGGTLGGLIGGAIGMPIKVQDGYLRMPVEDFRNAREIKEKAPEVERAVLTKIQQTPELSGKVNSDAILEAACTNGDCASAGVADEALCRDEVMPLIDSTKGTLRSLVTGPRLVQSLVDKACKFLDIKPEPIYGWIGFKNPNELDERKKSIAQRIIKIGLESELRKCLNPPGESRPNLSGCHIFDSSFFYGPKGKWIVQRDKSSPPGLVEEYLYVRLNQLNPSDVVGTGDQRTIGWNQLDLITEKPVKNNPPRIPWPPEGRYSNGEVDPLTWGNGTCQVIGDEAANGVDEGFPPVPDQMSTMAMAVNPDAAGNRLHIAFTLRSAYKGSPKGKEIIWANYPPRAELPPVSLPPNYGTAGAGARAFRVAVTESRAEMRALGYQYNWDFDGDRAIDSWLGNTVRKIKGQGAVAVCYVVNPVSGRTGVGMTKLE